MIPIAIIIEKDGELSLSVRARRKTLKASNYAAAERWRDKFLPKHFTHRARHRYAYAKRKDHYLEKKKVLARIGSKVQNGGRVDLVYSGFLKRVMDSHHRITATPGNATVRMAGPSYLKINYKPGRPHLANEITKVISAEHPDIGNAAQDAFVRTLKSIQTRTKKQLRGRSGRFAAV